MRFLIASDIHGSEFYFGKLLSIFKDKNFDHMLILGDILYHGPRNDLPKGYNPKKVIEQLITIKDKIIAVRGNCDAEVDQMVLPFPIMDTSTRLFADNNLWFLTHGHVIDKSTAPENVDIFLSGHTHIPILEKEKSRIIVNPGSISIPKGGSRESFMIYENRKFSLCDFEGNAIKELSLE